MSLDAYKALDLSMGGVLAKSLLSEVDREASSTSITLSNRHTANKNRPTFVTPAMSQWFGSNITTVRGAALDEVLKGFKDIDLARGQKGFLPEAENERIALDKYSEIEKERDTFFANGKVHRDEEELEVLTLDYEHKKAQQAGREAEEWSPWLYRLVLTLLALPEFPLNVAGFFNLGTFITGAMAYALTGAVAVGIGFSSHIIGESIKQYRAQFGRGVLWEVKFSYLRYLSLGTILFIVAMGIVTTVRYIYFKQQLSETVFGGGSSSPDYMTVFGTVGGNLLIWLIGVGVAYVAHDVVPGYGKLRRRMKTLQGKLDHLYAKQLQRYIDQKKAKAQDEENLLAIRVSKELANRPDYAEARKKFDQFRAVDTTIEAIFETYRGRLGERIRAGKATVEFCYDEIEIPRRNIRRTIDFPTYELQRMELRYGG